jgi:hypothetical protein
MLFILLMNILTSSTNSLCMTCITCKGYSSVLQQYKARGSSGIGYRWQWEESKVISYSYEFKSRPETEMPYRGSTSETQHIEILLFFLIIYMWTFFDLFKNTQFKDISSLLMSKDETTWGNREQENWQKGKIWTFEVIIFISISVIPISQ